LQKGARQVSEAMQRLDMRARIQGSPTAVDFLSALVKAVEKLEEKRKWLKQRKNIKERSKNNE
jgi:ribosomal protein S5